MKYADLHVHTDFSDGTFSPEEVVCKAQEVGLSSIAICDHDCIDAIPFALEHAKESNLEIIPGVELTVLKDGREIHLLGYFVSWEDKSFQNLLKEVQVKRLSRMDKMIERLKDFDIEIDKERVVEIAGRKGSIGRLHLAQALYESKAVSSIQKAFDKYIGDTKPCYVEDIGFEIKEAVKIIEGVGGISALAHPAMLGDDSLVLELIKSGIRGIEIYHTNHSPSDIRKYEKMADDYGLLRVGGSDCHGMGKGRMLMGKVRVPYELVEKVKEEADKIRNANK